MNDGAFRGVVLVALAVVIGIILLGSGLDDTGPVTVAADGDGGEETSGDGDEEPSTDTVVPDEVVDPSSIPVVVANGSGVEGAAGAVTELLIAAGYSPGDPTDTTVDASQTPLDTVYFIATPTSFQAQAEQVATDLGLPPESVVEMPNPPPADIGLAGVLVVLGSSPGGLAESAVSATTTPTTAPAG
jgi:hypothetical protein